MFDTEHENDLGVENNPYNLTTLALLILGLVSRDSMMASS
ncbi:MAG: hypothetical protein QOE88_2913, partial [Verrucomicrobiota bacterium]|nr:hypothetical protein [Verrucomicrobiota bacterium]